jgi:hypothetical protein
MGENAKTYVREFHDLNRNYQAMESVLQKVVGNVL